MQLQHALEPPVGRCAAQQRVRGGDRHAPHRSPPPIRAASCLLLRVSGRLKGAGVTLEHREGTAAAVDDYTGGGTLTELAATPVFAVLLVRLSVLYGNGKVPVLLDLGIVAVILAFVAIFLWEAGAI